MYNSPRFKRNVQHLPRQCLLEYTVGMSTKSLLIQCFAGIAITTSIDAKPFARRGAAAESTTAETRAIAYLAREVPSWNSKNACFSCHNNGDGARALYLARQLSYSFPADTLAATNQWLTRPDGWKDNGGDGPFNDRRLANIQFAFALTEALQAGAVKDKQALSRAAALVAADQDDDGSWNVEAEAVVGSPATYGPVLATVAARRVLVQADDVRFRSRIVKAERWLQSFRPLNTLHSAALLIAFSEPDLDVLPEALRRDCLNLIARAQADNGGWGAFVNSPPEAFDTAITLIALCGHAKDGEFTKRLCRGRGFLVELQLPDGSWPETTRPASSESYAQRLSTTAWATIALLKTRSCTGTAQPTAR